MLEFLAKACFAGLAAIGVGLVVLMIYGVVEAPKWNERRIKRCYERGGEWHGGDVSVCVKPGSLIDVRGE